MLIVEGELSMHGVTKKVTEKGTLTVSNNGIEGKAIFIVKPEDYKIKIPKTVVDNIAEELEVTVEVKLEEYKK